MGNARTIRHGQARGWAKIFERPLVARGSSLAVSPGSPFLYLSRLDYSASTGLRCR